METFSDVCKNRDKYEIVIIFECTQWGVYEAVWICVR
jgi:hypothetical protein